MTLAKKPFGGPCASRRFRARILGSVALKRDVGKILDLALQSGVSTRLLLSFGSVRPTSQEV